ncbi:hypothetical protein FOA52_005466 [Chlamydomonas sp. UWO 241]|nr:hypothetical protein FOA52_005466 [Chlamydomonas sp. UWO 241]
MSAAGGGGGPRFGEAVGMEGMEDLTAQLDSALATTYGGANDDGLGASMMSMGGDGGMGQGLGASVHVDDGSDPLAPPQPLDSDHGHGVGSSGLGGSGHEDAPYPGAGAASSAAAPVPSGPDGSPLSRSGMQPHGTAYAATYGELMPPSYADSVMLESAVTAGHAASGASDPLAGPSSGSRASGGAPPLHQHTDPVGGATTRLHYSSEPAAHGGSNGDAAGGSGGGGASPLGASRPSQRAAPLRVTVVDPVKREQAGLFGIKASYVAYLVTATATSGGAQTRLSKQSVSVRRRFSDFVALADVLKARFRGFFVSPRPEKNAVEGQRMADAFIEERRAALERYLATLAAHPTIATSEELAMFLETEGELSEHYAWKALVPLHQGTLVEGTAKLGKQILGLEKKTLDPVQAAQPTRSAADPLRAFKETAQSMQMHARAPDEAALQRAREGAEAHKDALMAASRAAETLVQRMDKGGRGAGAEDGEGRLTQPPPFPALVMRLVGSTVATWCADGYINAPTHSLPTLSIAASRAAEALVQRMDKVAMVQGDLGLSFLKAANYEELHGGALALYTGTARQQQALVTVGKAASNAMVRLSRLSRTVTGKAAVELGTLHEFLSLMPCVIKGLRQREKQLLTEDTLQGDLEAKNRAIRELESAGAKVFGGDAAKERKGAELRADVARLDLSIQAAHAEYEKIKGANVSELTRLQGDMRADLRHMLRVYATAQVLGLVGAAAAAAAAGDVDNEDACMLACRPVAQEGRQQRARA